MKTGGVTPYLTAQQHGGASHHNLPLIVGGVGSQIRSRPTTNQDGPFALNRHIEEYRRRKAENQVADTGSRPFFNQYGWAAGRYKRAGKRMYSADVPVEHSGSRIHSERR